MSQATMSVRELQQQVRKLTREQQLELLEGIARDLRTEQLQAHPPQDVAGRWAGQGLSDDIEGMLKEIRSEWMKDLDDV